MQERQFCVNFASTYFLATKNQNWGGSQCSNCDYDTHWVTASGSVQLLQAEVRDRLASYYDTSPDMPSLQR